MADDCQALVRSCQCCCAFKGAIPKAPLCPIRVHVLLELIHIDFTSVESMMELNKPPCTKNVLVITDHFTRYMLAVVTRDQTVKTINKVLYERFIVIFGASAKLLSNCGANFTSALVEELCTTFRIQKCHITVYHVQSNGQEERFHQTLFQMIGKLGRDKKAQWEQHLPILLQAYNSTQSAVMSYSPHYLMFGRHPCLPVDYYFPTVSTHKCSCHLPMDAEEVCKHFKEAYAEAHLQTNNEADRQKWYYDRVTSTVQLVPGDVVLLKSDAFQGKRKVKDRWGNSEYVVVWQVADNVPAYEVKDDGENIKVVHHNRLFLAATVSSGVTSLGASESLSEENIARSTLVELTPLVWENEVPESNLDEAATLSLASCVLLGWVDGVL